MSLYLTEIKNIIDNLSVPNTFLRATDIQANNDLNKLPQDIPRVIHLLEDVINYEGSEITQIIEQRLPVNILFLRVDTHHTKLTDSDTFLEEMEGLANEFYDSLIQTDWISRTTAIDSYTITPFYKNGIFDNMYTGVRLNLEILINRESYTCP